MHRERRGHGERSDHGGWDHAGWKHGGSDHGGWDHAGWDHGDHGRKMPLGVVAIVLWSLAWKGASLWRAAKDDSKPWFATLLLVNSAGILDALYLFVISPRAKKKDAEIIDGAEYPLQTHTEET